MRLLRGRGPHPSNNRGPHPLSNMEVMYITGGCRWQPPNRGFPLWRETAQGQARPQASGKEQQRPGCSSRGKRERPIDDEGSGERAEGAHEFLHVLQAGVSVC